MRMRPREGRQQREKRKACIRWAGRGHRLHLKQQHDIAHQEGAEEDEGDKVNVGQVGAAALVLILPRWGSGVGLTAFLPEARQHNLLPGLACGTPEPETVWLGEARQHVLAPFGPLSHFTHPFSCNRPHGLLSYPCGPSSAFHADVKMPMPSPGLCIPPTGSPCAEESLLTVETVVGL